MADLGYTHNCQRAENAEDAGRNVALFGQFANPEFLPSFPRSRIRQLHPFRVLHAAELAAEVLSWQRFADRRELQRVVLGPMPKVRIPHQRTRHPAVTELSERARRNSNRGGRA